jgi:hypothetical protein
VPGPHSGLLLTPLPRYETGRSMRPQSDPASSQWMRPCQERRRIVVRLMVSHLTSCLLPGPNRRARVLEAAARVCNPPITGSAKRPEAQRKGESHRRLLSKEILKKPFKGVLESLGPLDGFLDSV